MRQHLEDWWWSLETRLLVRNNSNSELSVLLQNSWILWSLERSLYVTYVRGLVFRSVYILLLLMVCINLHVVVLIVLTTVENDCTTEIFTKLLWSRIIINLVIQSFYAIVVLKCIVEVLHQWYFLNFQEEWWRLESCVDLHSRICLRNGIIVGFSCHLWTNDTSITLMRILIQGLAKR